VAKRFLLLKSIEVDDDVLGILTGQQQETQTKDITHNVDWDGIRRHFEGE